MIILYVTDLHGRRAAYERAASIASGCGARAIVNGGDLYPLGPDLFAVQQQFLQGWFREYLDSLADKGLLFLATLGNMDLAGLDDLFKEVMAESGSGRSLLDACTELDGWTFTGSAMTTDAPFALKDRCRRDCPDSVAPSINRAPLLSDKSGIHERPDWPAFCRELPDLAAHLDRLPQSHDPSHSVYVLHQPPNGLGLGTLDSGADAGSYSVREFLRRRQPRISLHGHIHESPFAGGCWRAEFGQTICIQPGQLPGGHLVSVVIDLDTLEMTRSIHEL